MVPRCVWVTVASLFLLVALSTTTTNAEICLAPNPLSGNTTECPFATWKDENGTAGKRNCYECRWCPFRRETCCEKDDEIMLLKNINVSGSQDWSCFITIAHFQECGKCSPDSLKYTIHGNDASPYLSYVPNPDCLAIAICTEACGYIYKQCKNTNKINGDPVIDPALYPNKDMFCFQARVREERGDPCYNLSSRDAPPLLLLLAACAILLGTIGL
eukprot:TRINITY_DN18507_c0_g2_i1.p1 TRINITY_DN18507_c0_g2~~TRINITY_DN18507_c0_g2_i1.p1  ORF type:complete len:233 (+),score=55.20 TRINITY_DN18507_c0_g2_i1:54-701(+)